MIDKLDLKPITFYPKTSAPVKESTYDVAVGISEKLINSTISSIYEEMYSLFLNDSTEVKDLKLTIAWNVKQPPFISLKPSVPALERLIAVYKQAAPPETSEHVDIQSALNSSQNVNIEMIAPNIEITLSIPDVQPVSLSLAMDIYCRIELTEKNELLIIPFDAQVTDPGLVQKTIQEANLPKSPSGNTCYDYEKLFFFLINDVLSPKALSMAQKLLPPIVIPELEYMGLSLTDLTLAIEDSYIIASAKVAEDVTSSIPRKVQWPTAGFFIAMSPQFLQDIVSSQLPLTINHHGSKKAKILGIKFTTIHWSYSITLANITKIDFSGSDIHITFNMDNKRSYLNAHYKFWPITYHPKFKFELSRDSFVSGEIIPNKQDMVYVEIKDLKHFRLGVLPASKHVLDEIVSFFVSVMADEILFFLPAMLKDKEFKICRLPTIKIPEEGIDFRVFPSNLKVKGLDGKIAVTGDIIVTGDIN